MFIFFKADIVFKLYQTMKKYVFLQYHLCFFYTFSNNKEEVKMNAPYKYDIVGSFLRDKEIKQAREEFSLGKITLQQLEEVENKSIENLD